MGTPVVYPQFKLKQNNGNAVDLDSDTIKVMIVSPAYTYSAAHDFIDDVSASQVSGTNYAAGGATTANKAIALDGSTVEWVHDDISWPQSAGGFSNGRTFVWYKDTGSAATSPLIMYMTEASDFGNVSGDLTLDGSATTGVLNVS